MDKDSSEIVKLTERIAKDPKSKLFVPLAEEYKKAGDIEMSIYVLSEGLKNNPGYVTARSFLGKLLTEKGDLPAAQKEFEEVVKAIPDNLMAQKKLGDLYALQDRIADAVSRYKLALALNPKDTEVGFLIAEAEAGRDIKKHLPKIKTAPAEDKQKKEQGPVASVTSQPPAGSRPGLKPEQKPPGKAPAPAVQEEAEEVLFVEPLDTPAGAFRTTASEIPDVLAERDAEPAAASGSGTEHEQDDDLFVLNDSFSPGEQAAGPEEPLALADREEPAESAAPFEEEREKQADDFTTDTLAELYISQGFYEKAVDIYERMLVDKPSSRKLIEKLDKVRAMASSAAGEGGTPQSAPSVPLSFEENEDPGTAAADTEFPAAVPPPPALDDWELPSGPLQLDDDLRPDAAAASQSGAGFEPREYVPPAAFSPENREEETEANVAKPAGLSPKQNFPVREKQRAGRKETIARLESWLKNIKKET